MTLVAIIAIAVAVLGLFGLLVGRRRKQERERIRGIRKREMAGHRQEAAAHESRGEELLVEAADKRRAAEELAQRADELEERGERALSHAERHETVAAQKQEQL
jgi:FtsZ-interacting cell division protein ZipA